VIRRHSMIRRTTPMIRHRIDLCLEQAESSRPCHPLVVSTVNIVFTPSH
jgi:hypothetical protein